MSACRCVGVTLLCDTSVGGPDKNRESRDAAPPPPSPASDRFGRLQATGYRHEEGFLRCERLPTGCIVTIPVPISGSDFRVSGFPGFLSIVQQRPVSKPERLLEPLALEPSRAEPCFSTETRDTRHEMRNASSRNTSSETRNPRTQKSRIQNPRIQKSRTQNPRTQEPKNPESMIKVDHYVARRALPGDSDDASVCRFSCVRRKV